MRPQKSENSEAEASRSEQGGRSRRDQFRSPGDLGGVSCWMMFLWCVLLYSIVIALYSCCCCCGGGDGGCSSLDFKSNSIHVVVKFGHFMSAE